MVEMIYALEDKRLAYYPGNYDYYLEKSQELKAREMRPARPAHKAGPKQSELHRWTGAREDRAKPLCRRTVRHDRTSTLQHDLEAVENEIARLESRIGENHRLMTEPANLSDYQYLHGLQEENATCEKVTFAMTDRGIPSNLRS